jgi:hypothetical protein
MHGEVMPLHWPAVHVEPLGHPLPHEPQLSGLVWTSMHVPPHETIGEVHPVIVPPVHAPSTHV